MSTIYASVMASIFTIDNGTFKIMLMRKTTEPYKGYWILPCEYLDNDKTVEEVVEECVSREVGLANLKYEQCGVFSDINREPDKRVVGISLFSIVDEVTALTHMKKTEYEIGWFPIDNLPKIGYDHSRVIDKSVSVLKDRLNQSKTLKQIYPCDFTLPEIQHLYEQVLVKELDRRNFRKKFLKLNLIEETGFKAPTTTGRPAKLYKFKEEIDNVILF